jgi:hypothetical protein
MPDPILNEQVILQMLDVPAGLVSAERLQTASMLALVNGFDRRIQREPFVRLAAAAMSTHTNLGRLQFTQLVVDLHNKQPLTAADLAKAMTEITAYCEVERLALVKQVQLVALCPTSTDNIN